MNDGVRFTGNSVPALSRLLAKTIASAVNEHGVRYRVLDGSHVRLYCEDRSVRPIKVAAARQEVYSMKHLLAWLEANVPSWPKRDVSPTDLEALAAVVNTAPRALRQRKVAIVENRIDGVPVTGVKVPLTLDQTVGSIAPFTAEMDRRKAQPKAARHMDAATRRAMAVHAGATRAAEIKDEREEPAVAEKAARGWRVHVAPSGRSFGFETDGSVFRCMTCGWTKDTGVGLHLHEASHTGLASKNAALAGKAKRRKPVKAAEPTEAALPVAQEPAEPEVALRVAQERTMLQSAVLALAAAHGIDFDPEPYDSKIESLTDELAQVRKTLEAIVHQRNDLQAKLDLMRETLGL